MDDQLEDYFKKNNIKYKLYTHSAVFTVEESKKNEDVQKIPGSKSKNLFLKDETGKFYLVCISSDKRLDMKNLRKILTVKNLYFASPIELKEELNLTPGSVSLFGIINSINVELILDEDLYLSESVCFHPNINTGTIVIDKVNLESFLNSLNCKKRILKI